MTAATCKVYRNGALMTINTVDLVVGDIISVEAGDSVPADARIIECSNLKVEEAALTGESVPVDKNNIYFGNSLGYIKSVNKKTGKILLQFENQWYKISLIKIVYLFSSSELLRSCPL